MTETGGAGNQPVQNVWSADLPFGTAHKVPPTNNEGSVVKQTRVVARFTPAS